MTCPASIIVFDAECILCSGHAQIVLRHDKSRRFLLASMQDETGQALYRRFGIDPQNPDTLLLVEGERALRDSDAVIAIYSSLGWPWKAVSALRTIPRFLRDPIYLWVARNRYRFFGRRDRCWVPSPEYKERILR